MHVGICNMHVETQHLFLMREHVPQHTRPVVERGRRPPQAVRVREQSCEDRLEARATS